MKRWLWYVFPLVMVFGLIVSAFVIVSALQAAPRVINDGTLSESVAIAQPVDPVAHGQELFVSKGCIVCHVNDRVSRLREGALEFTNVPNLTTVKVDRDYLRRWLHDPAAMKPTTEMPNLELSDAEIEALVAFLMVGKE